MQLKGKNKFGVSLHSRGNLWCYHQRAKEKGEPLEVAVFIGAHPAFYLAAGTRRDDEYRMVGGLLGEPVELVKCETVDVEVPTNAEIVPEGEILTDVEEDEGPFSEFTGYLSGRSTRNVMTIKTMTHRSHPIFQSLVPTNSTEHVILGGISKQAEIFKTMKASWLGPYIKSINWPTWGTHFAAIMSVRNETEGLVDQAASLLCGLDYYLKLIIVVDDDIDVYDEREVLWAVVTRSQPKDDFQVIPSSMGPFLDPSAMDRGRSSKLIIDATKPTEWLSKPSSPRRPTLPSELLEKVKKRLKKFDVG